MRAKGGAERGQIVACVSRSMCRPLSDLRKRCREVPNCAAGVFSKAEDKFTYGFDAAVRMQRLHCLGTTVGPVGVVACAHIRPNGGLRRLDLFRRAKARCVATQKLYLHPGRKRLVQRRCPFPALGIIPWPPRGPKAGVETSLDNSMEVFMHESAALEEPSAPNIIIGAGQCGGAE